MENRQAERKAAQFNALRPLGYNAWWERVFVVSVKNLGHETDHMRDPVSASMASVQDPTSGAPVFMAGFSAAGGDDPAG